MTPKFPDIEVYLSDEDGNAFIIIGKVQRALRRAGEAEAATQFRAEATVLSRRPPKCTNESGGTCGSTRRMWAQSGEGLGESANEPGCLVESRVFPRWF